MTRVTKAELRRCLEQNAGLADLELAAAGLADAVAMLPEDDVGAMVSPTAGRPVRWVPGEGWQD